MEYLSLTSEELADTFGMGGVSNIDSMAGCTVACNCDCNCDVSGDTGFTM